jgi:adenylate cyclase
MEMEIEKKYLVRKDIWKPSGSCRLIKQGYLSIEPARVVRVRIHGKNGYLTVKGLTTGISRLEFEYEIPLDEAERLLSKICIQPVIEKLRYRIDFEAHAWDVDVFAGENEGLIIAEIELTAEGQSFPLPEWVGEEVSYDSRFYNVNLVQRPYMSWKT